MVSVGVIGGTGYTGAELLRFLVEHPVFDLSFATSRSEDGNEIGDVLPSLRSLIDKKFVTPESDLEAELVFAAVPHTTAMDYVPSLIDRGMKVVDLSADYRLPFGVYEDVYETSHTDYGRQAVYGLPEQNKKEIKKAGLVANPGCYPTGAILSMLPLKDSFDRVIFDSKSGISGAGAKPSSASHFPNLNGNINPYKITSHRHAAEMKMMLSDGEAMVHFTPHVIPVVRGILTTAHVFGVEEEDLLGRYRDFYSDECFIRVIDEVPKLSSVRGSNYVDIGGFSVDETGRTVVVSAIDNLVKGAAGQAIQNANLMMGLDEETGLKKPPLSP
ncbi:N-acetyl-gamma-glutamyl-phosphate reductase [Methanonatronarchaeum sp. AMET6-2]|uniref:N-acetyl-gamma-glutamyl-phosphate reductase n=1 Tax=Methanonatronarchaeum sp. AMET6-2 TaxID=2933293 RepID=UPI001FF3C90F|nr:N-acetyl-gamma-glutamyl-phosphate reductase [Methanonatronarchaeum sp. AMET6-2]UOY10739.1 N-acetyl-gamma-glutamyl-phosphate reductase [Methanonatronarchaeum sp. AMET6-2]